MAACPVSRVTPRFPGPKQAGPGAQRFRSASEASVDDWIELCTGCRLCDMVCPAGVPISELNLMAKAKYLNERGRTFRDWLLVRSDLFGELAARFSKIVNPLMKNRTVRRLLDALLQIDRRRDLPGYEYPTFRRWFRTRPAPAGGRRKVAYFYGCFTNTNETDVGKAAVEVLEAHGLTVDRPAPALLRDPAPRRRGSPGGAGDGPPEHRPAQPDGAGGNRHRLLLDELRPDAPPRVRPASSTSPAQRSSRGRLFDICEFLLRLHEEEKSAVTFRPLSMKAAYFAPCHLRSLDIGLPALELLRLIPGLDVSLIEAECCGLGGLYGFKTEKFAIAEEIGKDLAEAVDRMKPDTHPHGLRGLPDADPPPDRPSGPPPPPAPPRCAETNRERKFTEFRLKASII